MSEVGWYNSEIKVLAGVKEYASNIEESPCFRILHQAMEMVAEEHHGSLVNAVVDYNGRETVCDLALVTPEFSRGIGIKVDRESGALKFAYDPYGGYEAIATAVTEAITQYYTTIALIEAMKSLGYEVREEPAENKPRKKVMITGVM